MISTIASVFLFALSVEKIHGFTTSPRSLNLIEQNGNKRSIATATNRMSVASSETEEGSRTSDAAKTPDMAAYSSGYRTMFEEIPVSVCTPSEGSLPKDLVGTYFRNGPSMYSAGSIIPPKTSIIKPKLPPVPDGQDPDRMVKHPFEADGGVLAVTFYGDNTATARFRYVRTNAFTNERKRGSKLYNAMEPTRDLGGAAGNGLGNDLLLPMFRHHLQPGLNKKRKNTSNTRAIYWGKRLLTLWEGGLPYKLDALALSTEGRSQLGGALKSEENPLGGKASFDSINNRMVFYSNIQNSGSSELTVSEFNSKFRLVQDGEGKVTVDLPGFAVLSDFAVTENYSIFVQPPVSTNGMQFMISKDPAKSLQVENSASTLHLVPRAGKGNTELRSFTIPFDGKPDAELQFCNAYENDNGSIVFDAIRSTGISANTGTSKPFSYPWSSSLEDYQGSTSRRSLWRYKLNVKSGTITKEEICDMQSYFGVINPKFSARKHQFVYTAVGSMGSDVAPPQGIMKVDCETKASDVWFPEEYEFCGEPMYAPRKNSDNADDEVTAAEDDGYILSVLYNGKTEKSEMVVLDATNIKAGPVSRLPLGVGLPHGLFGCFTDDDDATWSAEEIERRSKLADKMESRGSMWNEVKSDFSGLGLRFDDMEEYFGDMM